MAERYPLLLDLQGRACLVVGGGPVAARKSGALLRAGARLRVVAPDGVGEIAERAAAGELTWQRREFFETDLEGQELAFAATSSATVNQRVATAARQRRVWVNVADDPAGSDFHVPATLHRGPLTVAVASAGASPALAAWTRDRIATGLPAELAILAELAGALRNATGSDAEPFRALFESGILEDLCGGDWGGARRKVMERFGDGEAVRQVLSGFPPEG